MGNGTFAGERDRLRAELSVVSRLAEERGETAIADTARGLDKKLVEERFNVVVVGEFKRGKTTFVNALLGDAILPAAVVPLTSIVTAVTWGEEPRAEVTFLDGRVEQVPPEQLAMFVTERSNPENRLRVQRAVLSYPADELRNGVFLVDTPGVGSVYTHNTEAARAFVPEADAAVFLTSADPPISATERSFLEEVRSEASHMFFVLNKVDYLSEHDRSEAIGFTRRVLEEALGRAVALYPVSARQALDAKVVGDERALHESGFAAFEHDFRTFLLREKGRTILASVTGQARRLVADLRNSLDVEERAAQLSQDQLARTLDQMEEVFASATTRREDMRALLGRERERIVRMLEADLEELRTGEEEALRVAAASSLAEADDLRRAGPALDQVMRATLRADIDRWRRDEDRRIAAAFQEATARFVDETERVVAEMIRLCGDILGIQLASSSTPAELSLESRFTYSFFEVPTILESLIPDLRGYLPKALARKLFERDVMEQIPRLVDMHCGRLRYDFVERLDRSRDSLERALDARLEGTIDSLRSGVRRSEEESSRISREAGDAAEVARSMRAALEELDRRLEMPAAAPGGTP